MKQKIHFLLILLLLNTLSLFADEESDALSIAFDSELNSFSAVGTSANYTTKETTFPFVASDGLKYSFKTMAVKLENGMLVVQGSKSGDTKYIKSPRFSATNGYVVTVRYYQSYTSGTTSISKLSYGTSANNSVLAKKDGTKYGDYIGFTATLEVPNATAFTFTTGSNRAFVYRIEIVYKVVKLDEGEDNTNTISNYYNQAIDVALGRTLVANKWNTFCVPFDIKGAAAIFKDAEIKEYNNQKGVVENVMYFKNTNDIVAGYPYLIRPKEDIKNPTFKNVNISETEPKDVGNEDYKFVGVFSPLTFSGSMADMSLFLSGDEKLILPIPETTMKGMRAYFSFPGNVPAQSAKISMENGETSIVEIIEDAGRCEEKVFNLNGSCVGTSLDALPRGVYVKSGKKIIIK